MKLVNKTKWNSNDLKKLIVENIRKEGLDPVGYVVELVNSRSGHYTGLGSYYKHWIRIRVPSLVTKFWAVGSDGKGQYIDQPTIFDTAKFSKIVAHELAHNRGLKHKDMSDHLRWKGDWERHFEWAKTFKIRCD